MPGLLTPQCHLLTTSTAAAVPLSPTLLLLLDRIRILHGGLQAPAMPHPASQQHLLPAYGSLIKDK